MRDTTPFRLGQVQRSMRNVDPPMTVLEYLRGPERPCGTKEGCAEGDCAACTLVLVHRQGRYQAANSCILFVPALDDCQSLSVEHHAADGVPHPVQPAMADHHGSQGGFCTPGFVMSMFALSTEARADRAAINEALVCLIGFDTERARFVGQLARRNIASEKLIRPIGQPAIEGMQPAMVAVSVAAQILSLSSHPLQSQRSAVPMPTIQRSRGDCARPPLAVQVPR
jgi:aerobic-type carbon monoxide dehydrogenase small subunit (CoxS/CutS family)